MTKETTIDEKGFVHHIMLQYHLEDIEMAAEGLEVTLTEEELKKVAIAMFEDNYHLAKRIVDLLYAEAIETIQTLKNS